MSSRSRSPHRTHQTEHVSIYSDKSTAEQVRSLFHEVGEHPVLDLPRYPMRSHFDYQQWLRAVVQNLVWHHRLMLAMTGVQGTANIVLNQAQALQRCALDSSKAQQEVKTYEHDCKHLMLVTLANLADMIQGLNSDDREVEERDAKAWLSLIGSRFGWRAFEDEYYNDIMNLKLSSPGLDVSWFRGMRDLAGTVLAELPGLGQCAEMPEIVPVSKVSTLVGFVGSNAIYINSQLRVFRTSYLEMDENEPLRIMVELFTFRFLIHELANFFLRFNADDLNWHSPLKMKLPTSARCSYPEAKSIPKGPEAGCVAERCCFNCRPRFDEVGNDSAKLKDWLPTLQPLIDFIRGKGSKPTFPIDLRALDFPSRQDQITGLDSMVSHMLKE
jgi:hypothetical protein